MERIPCSYDPTDDLRIDLAEAKAEIKRLREALSDCRTFVSGPAWLRQKIEDALDG